MKSVNFSHNMQAKVFTYDEFLNMEDLEYRTLYKNNKWTASQHDPTSGFYVAPTHNT